MAHRGLPCRTRYNTALRASLVIKFVFHHYLSYWTVMCCRQALADCLQPLCCQFSASCKFKKASCGVQTSSNKISAGLQEHEPVCALILCFQSWRTWEMFTALSNATVHLHCCVLILDVSSLSTVWCRKPVHVMVHLYPTHWSNYTVLFCRIIATVRTL